MLIKLNDELETSVAISKKKNTIREKLEEFSKMIDQGTKFEEYDGDVFEAVIHKVIVGGDDKNGNFDPYQITYVFNLVGTVYSSTDNHIIVGHFE